MKIDLTGKNALIGGSSKGIGLGIATELANSGASVCLMARNETKLKEIVDQLPNSENHSYIVVDFSKFEELDLPVFGGNLSKEDINNIYVSKIYNKVRKP